MARPLRIEFSGGLYHTVSHGNGRLWLFKDDESRVHFLAILGRYSVKYKVIVHIFLLMKNHFHILAETRLPNLSQFMSQFLRAYAMYYNRRFRRKGSVFRSRYGAFIVQKDKYYKQLTRYIYNNPVKAGVVRSIYDYRWSSLYYILHKNQQKKLKWYNNEVPLSLLGGLSGLRDLLAEDIEELPTVYNQFVGERDWADRLLKGRRISEEISGGFLMKKGYISPGEIIGEIAKHYRISRRLILEGRHREATLLAIYLIAQHTPLNLTAIGKMFGLQMYAVAQRLRRFRAKELGDKRIQHLLTSLEKKLLSSYV